MKKLIFLDIDGTLCMPGQAPSPAVVGAIRKARQNGHKVFLSTGRTENSIPEAIRQLEFDGGIYSAGGKIVVDRKIIREKHMPKRLSHAIIELMKEEQINYMLECESFIYFSETAQASKDAILFSRASSELKRILLQREQSPQSKSTHQYQGEPIYKVVFMASTTEQIDCLRDKIGGTAKLVCFQNLLQDVPLIAGEVSDWSINKGDALRYLCLYLDLTPENCIAFGDSMNDAEIIEAAGVGVAMGNSEPAVLALADHICESCEEDGVAKAFKRLRLL